jgi:hypothetical protein
VPVIFSRNTFSHPAALSWASCLVRSWASVETRFLAGGDALLCLLALVRGELRLAAELDAVGNGAGASLAGAGADAALGGAGADKVALHVRQASRARDNQLEPLADG